MSILLKGIDLPKDCNECWEKYHGFGMVQHDEEYGIFWCKFANGWCGDIRTKCPLVEVPPHGRLIDADVPVKCYYYDDNVEATVCCYETLANFLGEDCPPTVIEAEEGEE